MMVRIPYGDLFNQEWWVNIYRRHGYVYKDNYRAQLFVPGWTVERQLSNGQWATIMSKLSDAGYEAWKNATHTRYG